MDGKKIYVKSVPGLKPEVLFPTKRLSVSRKKEPLVYFPLGDLPVEPLSACGDFSGEDFDSVPENTERQKGTRVPVLGMSRHSLSRLKLTCRNTFCELPYTVTLTYPGDYPKDGKTCKKHLNLFLTHVRKDYKGIKYLCPKTSKKYDSNLLSVAISRYD